MELIRIGAKAPDFNLDNVRDEAISLADFRGKKVLLSWHPLAWTGVCGDQMRSLEVNFDKFQALNAVALGLNVDPSTSKKAWGAVLGVKKTALLSDFWPHGQAASAYGVFLAEEGFSQRANIIVDETGVVRWAKVYPISQLPDINEVLQALAQL